MGDGGLGVVGRGGLVWSGLGTGSVDGWLAGWLAGWLDGFMDGSWRCPMRIRDRFSDSPPAVSLFSCLVPRDWGCAGSKLTGLARSCQLGSLRNAKSRRSQIFGHGCGFLPRCLLSALPALLGGVGGGAFPHWLAPPKPGDLRLKN